MTHKISGSCVVAGFLNPAIINPKWMVEQKLLPDGDVEIQMDVMGGGSAFLFAGATWRCSLTRLEVSSEDPAIDVGGYVAPVFELLTHTPVKAIGNNFEFEVPAESRDGLYRMLESPLEAKMNAGPNKVTGKRPQFTLAHGDAAINVQLDAGNAAVAKCSLNFHRAIVRADEVVRHAKVWASDRKQAVEILNYMIGAIG